MDHSLLGRWVSIETDRNIRNATDRRDENLKETHNAFVIGSLRNIQSNEMGYKVVRENCMNVEKLVVSLTGEYIVRALEKPIGSDPNVGKRIAVMRRFANEDDRQILLKRIGSPTDYQSEEKGLNEGFHEAYVLKRVGDPQSKGNGYEGKYLVVYTIDVDDPFETIYLPNENDHGSVVLNFIGTDIGELNPIFPLSRPGYDP